jgi:hypothetical protein
VQAITVRAEVVSHYESIFFRLLERVFKAAYHIDRDSASRPCPYFIEPPLDVIVCPGFGSARYTEGTPH